MKKSNLAVFLVLGLPLAALAAVRRGSSTQTAEDPSATTQAVPPPVSSETQAVPAEPEHPADPHDHSGPAWKAPLTWKCKGDRAWLAGPMTFSSPTPDRLREALATATTKGSAALVTVPNGTDFLVALSGTEPRANKLEAFPAAVAPSFVRLVDGFGDPPGISSDRFQPKGYLRIADGQKYSWIELRNINWRAVEKSGCGELSVDAYAQVPQSSWGVSLRTSAGPRAIRDLVEAGQLAPSAPQQAPGRDRSAEPPAITLHFAFTASAATVERSSPRGPS